MNEVSKILVFLAVTFLIILVAILTTNTLNNLEYYSFIKLMVFLLYIISVFYSMKKYGVFHSITLFLFSFFLFNISRIFLDLINVKSMDFSDKYVFYLIESSTYNIVLNSFFIFLFVFLMVIFLINKPNYVLTLKNNVFLEKIMTYLIIILTPIVLVKHFQELTSFFMNNKSYFSMFDNKSTSDSILNYIWFFYYFIIPIYFSSLPKMKIRKFIYFIVAFVIFLDSLKGSRGVLLRPIVFYIWYFNLRGFKFNKINLFLGVFFIPLLSNVYVWFREGGKVFLDYFKSLVVFLYSQGVTLVFFVNYIDFQNRIPNSSKYYFLSGIIEPIRRYILDRELYNSGRNLEFVKSTFSLDHKLMYTLDQELYFEGVGYGSNIVAEFLAFGDEIGVVFLTIIFLFIILKIEKYSRSSRAVLIISFYWIQNLVWSPRGTMFPNIIFVMISLFLFFIIKFFCYINSFLNKKSECNAP